MAFGFSPKHLQDFPLGEFDQEHFLVLALEAATQLNWNIGFVSESGFIAYSKISWSSWSEEITVKIENGTAQIKSECTGNQIYDWGKNKNNIEKFISSFNKVKSELTKEEIESRLTELKPELPPQEDDILSKPPLTGKEKITDFFSLFKPAEGYFISPILININILVYITMIVSGVHFMMPENQSLIDWGANFKPMTLEGQWWRLFTACFIHIGFLHLLLNLYALLYIGLLLEPYLGRTRFLSAYLISGIAASLTSLWWNDLTISAGASGAIFGMYGVFLALLSTNLLDQSAKKTLLTSIAVFVGYNLINGLKPDSGVDNAAHIGGLLSGIMIGYAYIPSLKKFNHAGIKFSTIAALSVLLLIFSFTIYKTLPNDLGEYERKMEQFAHMESMALEIYNLPEETTDEELLQEIKNKGIYYWNENIKLLDSLNELELPLEIRARNSSLKEYCQLRLKSYQLIYKSIDENSDQYDYELNETILKIDSTITSLAGN